NQYTFLPYQAPSGSKIRSIKSGALRYYYGEGPISDNQRNSGMMLVEYPTVSEVFYLSSDTTKVYDKETNDELITINTYEYDDIPIVLKSQQTNTSKGETSRLVYKYPSDYTYSGFAASLVDSNYLRFPLEV